MPSAPPSGDPYAGSPLAALCAATGLDPDAPGTGVIIGRGGVGKTALLDHFGFHYLLSDRKVLHVSLRKPVDQVRAHSDEVLRSVLARNRLTDAALRVERGRVVHSYAGRALVAETLRGNLEVLAGVAQFVPTAVLIDGFDGAQIGTALPWIRELARRNAIRCWIAVRLTDANDGASFLKTEGADRDLAVRLVPSGRTTNLAGVGRRIDPPLLLDPRSLLAVHQDILHTEVAGQPADLGVKARECTLYSGGAAGTEAVFGELAERWGAREVNFTFEGHFQARVRSRYVLSPKELAVGDVSLAYVSKRLNRDYNDKGGLIRGVLQTLWHMVSRSQQVFVVGAIQPDGTVIGGTGWSVELARMWSRDLWVYDQERSGWFRWDGGNWTTGVPKITSVHLCGTGTRYLTAEGRAAIEDLFRRSFE